MSEPFPNPARIRAVLKVLRRATATLHRSRLPQMAGALAYRTLFSLIPMLVVALVLVKAFSSEEQVKELFEQILDFSGISHITVDQSSPEAFMESSDAAARLDEWIQDRVNDIVNIKLGAIGLIGGLVLIYAAISMLVEIERAFNQIYHAPTARSWVHRFFQYWTILTLGSVCLAATFFVMQRFLVYIDGSFAFGLVGYVVTVAISTSVILLIYQLVPNTRVQLRSALAGAFVAAVLWEAGKWGFTRYIDYSSQYQRLYGSLAILPLFMLWVYVTWIIILLGLHVSYMIQTYGLRLPPEESQDDNRPRVIDPAFAVAALGAVTRSFADGKTATSGDVADQTGLATDVVQPILERLRCSGCLHALEEGDGSTAYALARPPDSIRLCDVLDGMFELASAKDDSPAAHVLQRLRDAQHREAAALTASDLVHNHRAAPPIPAPAAETDASCRELTPGQERSQADPS